ncbi:hypothetical protein ABPG73_016450 [Tetrahymena malaccensis]
MRVKIINICFILQYQIFINCLQYDQQKKLIDQQVFSSVEANQINLNTICSSQQLRNIILLQKQLQNYFFAISDSCGLILSQVGKTSWDYQSVQSYEYIQNIQTVVYNYETDTLWVSDSSKYTISIYNSTDPTKLYKVNSITDFSQLTYFIYFSFDNQQVFFIQSLGTIQIYYQEGIKLTFIQSFINPNYPASILVLNNYNLFILGGYNLYFYQIQNINYNPTQAYQLSSYQQIVSGDNTPKMYFVDNKYLFTWSTFTGLNQYDISSCLQTQICNNNSVVMVATQKQQILGFQDIYLTKDTNYFIVFYTFFGLYTYDISLRAGFVQYQSISLKGLSTAMGVSSDESFIILTLDQSLNIYRQVPSNLNIQTPNLLNIHQNTLFNQHVQSIKTFWRCQIDDNLNLVISNGANGAWLMNINPINFSLNIVNHMQFNFPNNILDEARFLSGLKYIALAPGYQIYFYQRSADLSQIQLLSIYIPPMNNTHIGCIRQSKDGNTLFVAAGQVGLIVIDITDITNPIHITAVYYTYAMAPNSQSKGIWLSNDEKYLYMTYRYLGVVIYDISDFRNPKQVNVVYTMGGEDVMLTDDNLNMVVVETIYGLSFWSLEQNRTQPIKQAAIRTDGYAVHMRFIQNNNFILTTSLYKGQLFLINYIDRSNPKLVQSYQYQELENTSGDICISPDESFSFMIFPNGIVYLPLRNPVVFHTDIIWIQDIPNSFAKKRVLMNPVNFNSPTQPLQVGMNVILQLNQIYGENKIVLIDAQYYQNLEVNQLPNWITISEKSFNAMINVDKSAIDQNIIQQYLNLQTKGQGVSSQIALQNLYIIFQFSERVSNIDFQQNTIGITSAMSDQIFNDCINFQIILDSGFINPNYSDNQISSSLTNSIYTPEVIEQVKYILRRKITYYPVEFQIQNSLFVDIYSQSKIITSLSSTLVVQLYVNQNQALFLNKNYPAVLTSFSSNFDQIQIQGSSDSVNSVLLNGIKFHNLTDISQIQMKLEVKDGINYDLYKEFFCNETQIVSLNSVTIKNPNISLQNDFNNKYSQGSISILTKFDYQISSDIFVNNEALNLIYSAFIIHQNGSQSAVGRDQWFTFDQDQKTFSGLPQLSQFNTVLKLKIIATDGYTQAEDSFEININLIPLSYVLTVTIQIISPIIGIIGFWKYSPNIYNKLYKSKHETSQITILAGQQFELQIPLIQEELDIAKKIWIKYFKSMPNSDFIVALRKSKERYQKYHQQIYQQKNLNSLSQSDVVSNNQEISFATENNYNVNKTQLCNERQDSLSSQNRGSPILFNIQNSLQSPLKKQNLVKQQMNSNYDLHNNFTQALQKYCPQDWYKNYVTIIHRIDLIQTHPFPNIIINQAALSESLNIFSFDTFQLEQRCPNFFIFRPLIEDYIIAYSQGFIFDTFFVVPRPIGESLQMKSHSLKCIETYIPVVNGSSCIYLKKLLDKDYVQKELVDNSKLNSWIQLIDISNKVFILKGVPSNKDVGKYLFKIIDFKGYIVKRIHLEVQYNYKLDQNQIDVNTRHRSKFYERCQSVINNTSEKEYNLEFEYTTQEGQAFNMSKYESQTKQNSQNISNFNNYFQGQEYFKQ